MSDDNTYGPKRYKDDPKGDEKGSIFFEAIYRPPKISSDLNKQFWKKFDTDRDTANLYSSGESLENVNQGSLFIVNEIQKGTEKDCLIYMPSTKTVTSGKITYDEIQAGLDKSQFLIDSFGNVYIWNGERSTDSKIQIWKNPAFPSNTGFENDYNPYDTSRSMAVTYMKTGITDNAKRYREYKGNGIILSNNGKWMFKKDLTPGIYKFYILYDPINSGPFKDWYEAQPTPVPGQGFDYRKRNNAAILHKYCEMVATKPSRRDVHPSASGRPDTYTTNGLNNKEFAVKLDPVNGNTISLNVQTNLTVISGETVIVRSKNDPNNTKFEGTVQSYRQILPQPTPSPPAPLVPLSGVLTIQNIQGKSGDFSRPAVFKIELKGYIRPSFNPNSGTVRDKNVIVVGSEFQPQVGSDGLRGYGDPLCKYVAAKECTATLYGVPNKDYTSQSNVSGTGTVKSDNRYTELQDACMCKSSTANDTDEMGIIELEGTRPESIVGIVKGTTATTVDKHSVFWRDQYKQFRSTQSECPTTTEMNFCSFDIKAAGDFNMVDSSMSCGSNASKTVPTPRPINCVYSPFRELNDYEKSQQPRDRNVSCIPCRTNQYAKVRLARDIDIPAAGAGTPCPPLSEMEKDVECRSSENTVCPVDCILSDWSGWSECDKATGTQKRTKSILQPNNPIGAACGPMEETRNCAVNCEMNEWGSWGPCDKNTGEKIHTRTVKVQPKNNGTPCGPTAEPTQCPVDCEMNPWGNYGDCDPQSGKKIRTRSVYISPKNGGRSCDADTDSADCPVNCKMSGWSDYGTCDKLTGQKTRTRTVLIEPKNGGQECGDTSQTANCPVNCEQGEWVNEGGCRNGYQKQVRETKVSSLNGGTPCGPTERLVPCNDCELSDWKDSTECTKTCGGGKKSQTREITKRETAGGIPCSSMPLTQEVNCNTQPCPIDCVMGEWTDDGECDKKCGGGKRKQTRKILVNAAYGGKECGPTQQFVDCNTQPCPVDCVLSDWKDDGKCDKECGGGKQKQKREVSVAAAHGGKQCSGPMEQEIDCNKQACPIYKNPVVIGVGVIAVVAVVYYLSTSSAAAAVPLSMKTMRMRR